MLPLKISAKTLKTHKIFNAQNAKNAEISWNFKNFLISTSIFRPINFALLFYEHIFGGDIAEIYPTVKKKIQNSSIPKRNHPNHTLKCSDIFAIFSFFFWIFSKSTDFSALRGGQLLTIPILKKHVPSDFYEGKDNTIFDVFSIKPLKLHEKTSIFVLS